MLTLRDIVGFIKARLDDEERTALDCPPWPWRPNAEGDEILAADGIPVAEGFALSGRQLRATVEHIARQDPARTLRRVAAYRAILFEHQRVILCKGGGADYHNTARVCMSCGGSDAQYNDGTPAMRAAAHPCRTLRHMATEWSDHPDYDTAWSVTA